MKVHAGVDKDSGLIHSVVVTAANILDLTPASELLHGAEEVVYSDAVQLVLDSTPFYGEGGGQVGDRGVLSGDGVIVSIEGVSRNRSVFVHSGHIERGSLAIGDLVTARVDGACRRRAQANHTATHLLQAALKQIVDPAIGQAGSLVDFDRLRFDFHCPRAVTPAELEQIEAMINGWISEAHRLEVQEMAIEQAKAGALAHKAEPLGDYRLLVNRLDGVEGAGGRPNLAQAGGRDGAALV